MQSNDIMLNFSRFPSSFRDLAPKVADISQRVGALSELKGESPRAKELSVPIGTPKRDSTSNYSVYLDQFA